MHQYLYLVPTITLILHVLLCCWLIPSTSRPNVWKVRLLLLCRYCMYGLCTATCIFSNLQCTWRTEKKVCEIQTHHGIKIQRARKHTGYMYTSSIVRTFSCTSSSEQQVLVHLCGSTCTEMDSCWFTRNLLYS